MKVEWSDPPPHPPKKSRGNGIYDAFREELRRRPGKWAVLKRDGNVATAYQFKLGKVWEGFEIEQRTVDGRLTVYARFVGTNGEKP